MYSEHITGVYPLCLGDGWCLKQVCACPLSVVESEKDLKGSKGLSRRIRIERLFRGVLRPPQSLWKTGPCIIREYLHVGASCQCSMG